LKGGDGDPQKIAVEKACDLVRKELDGTEDRKWSVKALATEVGLTESHFCRIFKKVMGMTVGEYRASNLPVNVESLPGVNDTDQQHVAGITRDPIGSIPTANIPAAYGYQNCLPLADFDCPELEQDWHRFSGMFPSVAMFNYPNMDFETIDSDQSSPDHFSDSANVDLTDDGFQFLDFDCIGSVKLLS
jgi:hypothetical protein